MAAHDARGLGVHPEVLEDAGHHALVVKVGVERVLDLLARLLLGYEIQLERGHLALREQGRPLAQPHIPQQVAAALAHLGVGVVERRAHVALHDVVERAPLVLPAEHVRLPKRAVGVQRHAGVEQQAAVVHLVEAAGLQEETHVALQLLAARERLLQALHDLFLLGREAVGVVRVHRGEHRVGERVLHAVQHDRATLVVDLVQELAVCKAESGILVDELRLHLELDDGHGLLDLHVHLQLLRRQVRVALEAERDARVVGVGARRERRERQDVDAVGVLQYGQVAVARAVAHHVRDAAALAERGAHPHDVVVAPLDVERVVAHERVHDDVGVRPAIVDVADDVQMVDGQTLDEQAQRLDERAHAVGADDGVDDGRVVGLLVGALAVLGHQLLDDVREIARQRLAHAGARVLLRGALAHGHEARQHGLVPCLRVVHLGQHQLHLLARVVDERGQRALLGRAQRVAEHVVDLEPDGARAVAQDMRERLVLAVNVRGEELGALRQVQDGAQVDDLRRSLGGGGERPREKFQVPLFHRIHVGPPCGCCRACTALWYPHQAHTGRSDTETARLFDGSAEVRLPDGTRTT